MSIAVTLKTIFLSVLKIRSNYMSSENLIFSFFAITNNCGVTELSKRACVELKLFMKLA